MRVKRTEPLFISLTVFMFDPNPKRTKNGLISFFLNRLISAYLTYSEIFFFLKKFAVWYGGTVRYAHGGITHTVIKLNHVE